MAIIGKDIEKAARLLEEGKLVAIPTETVYGLAGNALNLSSVTDIFKVKDRPFFDPLIIHVPDLSTAEKYVVDMPAMAMTLVARFWPGPLTLLLEKKNVIPDLVTAGMHRVGIRSPDQPLTHQLLKRLSFPLAAPSANPFGYISPTRPVHVNDQLGDKIGYILDGGPCQIGIESTIIGFEEGRPVLYRPGGLSLEKIESVIGRVNLHKASEKPVAPGQTVSHYAPTKKLVLGDFSTSLKKFGNHQVGLLSFRAMRQEVDQEKQIILSPNGNLEEAAQNLFAALRELDKMDIKMILAEEVPETGLGRAINDRLRRAAESEM